MFRTVSDRKDLFEIFEVLPHAEDLLSSFCPFFPFPFFLEKTQIQSHTQTNHLITVDGRNDDVSLVTSQKPEPCGRGRQYW
jgi:hypothetical protein